MQRSGTAPENNSLLNQSLSQVGAHSPECRAILDFVQEKGLTGIDPVSLQSPLQRALTLYQVRAEQKEDKNTEEAFELVLNLIAKMAAKPGATFGFISTQEFAKDPFGLKKLLKSIHGGLSSDQLCGIFADYYKAKNPAKEKLWRKRAITTPEKKLEYAKQLLKDRKEPNRFEAAFWMQKALDQVDAEREKYHQPPAKTFSDELSKLKLLGAENPFNYANRTNQQKIKNDALEAKAGSKPEELNPPAQIQFIREIFSKISQTQPWKLELLGELAPYTVNNSIEIRLIAIYFFKLILDRKKLTTDEERHIAADIQKCYQENETLLEGLKHLYGLNHVDNDNPPKNLDQALVCFQKIIYERDLEHDDDYLLLAKAKLIICQCQKFLADKNSVYAEIAIKHYEELDSTKLDELTNIELIDHLCAIAKESNDPEQKKKIIKLLLEKTKHLINSSDYMTFFVEKLAKAKLLELDLECFKFIIKEVEKYWYLIARNIIEILKEQTLPKEFQFYVLNAVCVVEEDNGLVLLEKARNDLIVCAKEIKDIPKNKIVDCFAALARIKLQNGEPINALANLKAAIENMDFTNESCNSISEGLWAIIDPRRVSHIAAKITTTEITALFLKLITKVKDQPALLKRFVKEFLHPIWLYRLRQDIRPAASDLQEIIRIARPHLDTENFKEFHALMASYFPDSPLAIEMGRVLKIRELKFYGNHKIRGEVIRYLNEFGVKLKEFKDDKAEVEKQYRAEFNRNLQETIKRGNLNEIQECVDALELKTEDQETEALRKTVINDFQQLCETRIAENPDLVLIGPVFECLMRIYQLQIKLHPEQESELREKQLALAQRGVNTTGCDVLNFVAQTKLQDTDLAPNLQAIIAFEHKKEIEKLLPACDRDYFPAVHKYILHAKPKAEEEKNALAVKAVIALLSTKNEEEVAKKYHISITLIQKMRTDISQFLTRLINNEKQEKLKQFYQWLSVIANMTARPSENNPYLIIKWALQKENFNQLGVFNFEEIRGLIEPILGDKLKIDTSTHAKTAIPTKLELQEVKDAPIASQTFTAELETKQSSTTSSGNNNKNKLVANLCRLQKLTPDVINQTILNEDKTPLAYAIEIYHVLCTNHQYEEASSAFETILELISKGANVKHNSVDNQIKQLKNAINNPNFNDAYKLCELWDSLPINPFHTPTKEECLKKFCDHYKKYNNAEQTKKWNWALYQLPGKSHQEALKFAQLLQDKNYLVDAITVLNDVVLYGQEAETKSALEQLETIKQKYGSSVHESYQNFKENPYRFMVTAAENYRTFKKQNPRTTVNLLNSSALVDNTDKQYIVEACGKASSADLKSDATPTTSFNYRFIVSLRSHWYHLDHGIFPYYTLPFASNDLEVELLTCHFVTKTYSRYNSQHQGLIEECEIKLANNKKFMEALIALYGIEVEHSVAVKPDPAKAIQILEQLPLDDRQKIRLASAYCQVGKYDQVIATLDELPQDFYQKNPTYQFDIADILLVLIKNVKNNEKIVEAIKTIFVHNFFHHPEVNDYLFAKCDDNIRQVCLAELIKHFETCLNKENQYSLNYFIQSLNKHEPKENTSYTALLQEVYTRIEETLTKDTPKNNFSLFQLYSHNNKFLQKKPFEERIAIYKKNNELINRYHQEATNDQLKEFLQFLEVIEADKSLQPLHKDVFSLINQIGFKLAKAELDELNRNRPHDYWNAIDAPFKKLQELAKRDCFEAIVELLKLKKSFPTKSFADKCGICYLSAKAKWMIQLKQVSAQSTLDLDCYEFSTGNPNENPLDFAKLCQHKVPSNLSLEQYLFNESSPGTHVRDHLHYGVCNALAVNKDWLDTRLKQPYIPPEVKAEKLSPPPKPEPTLLAATTVQSPSLSADNSAEKEGKDTIARALRKEIHKPTGNTSSPLYPSLTDRPEAKTETPNTEVKASTPKLLLPSSPLTEEENIEISELKSQMKKLQFEAFKYYDDMSIRVGLQKQALFTFHNALFTLLKKYLELIEKKKNIPQNKSYLVAATAQIIGQLILYYPYPEGIINNLGNFLEEYQDNIHVRHLNAYFDCNEASAARYAATRDDQFLIYYKLLSIKPGGEFAPFYSAICFVLLQNRDTHEFYDVDWYHLNDLQEKLLKNMKFAVVHDETARWWLCFAQSKFAAKFDNPFIAMAQALLPENFFKLGNFNYEQIKKAIIANLRMLGKVDLALQIETNKTIPIIHPEPMGYVYGEMKSANAETNPDTIRRLNTPYSINKKLPESKKTPLALAIENYNNASIPNENRQVDYQTIHKRLEDIIALLETGADVTDNSVQTARAGIKHDPFQLGTLLTNIEKAKSSQRLKVIAEFYANEPDQQKMWTAKAALFDTETTFVKNLEKMLAKLNDPAYQNYLSGWLQEHFEKVINDSLQQNSFDELLACIKTLANYQIQNAITTDAIKFIKIKLQEALTQAQDKTQVAELTFCLFHLNNINEHTKQKNEAETIAAYKENLALMQNAMYATTDHLLLYHRFLQEVSSIPELTKDKDIHFRNLKNMLDVLLYDKSLVGNSELLQRGAQEDYLPAVYKLAKSIKFPLGNTYDNQLALLYLCGKIRILADPGNDPENKFGCDPETLKEMRTFAEDYLNAHPDKLMTSAYFECNPSENQSADSIILQHVRDLDEQHPRGKPTRAELVITGMKKALNVDEAWIAAELVATAVVPDSKSAPTQELKAPSENSPSVIADLLEYKYNFIEINKPIATKENNTPIACAILLYKLYKAKEEEAKAREVLDLVLALVETGADLKEPSVVKARNQLQDPLDPLKLLLNGLEPHSSSLEKYRLIGHYYDKQGNKNQAYLCYIEWINKSRDFEDIKFVYMWLAENNYLNESLKVRFLAAKNANETQLHEIMQGLKKEHWLYRTTRCDIYNYHPALFGGRTHDIPGLKQLGKFPEILLKELMPKTLKQKKLDETEILPFLLFSAEWYFNSTAPLFKKCPQDSKVVTIYTDLCDAKEEKTLSNFPYRLTTAARFDEGYLTLLSCYGSLDQQLMASYWLKNDEGQRRIACHPDYMNGLKALYGIDRVSAPEEAITHFERILKNRNYHRKLDLTTINLNLALGYIYAENFIKAINIHSKLEVSNYSQKLSTIDQLIHLATRTKNSEQEFNQVIEILNEYLLEWIPDSKHSFFVEYIFKKLINSELMSKISLRFISLPTSDQHQSPLFSILKALSDNCNKDPELRKKITGYYEILAAGKNLPATFSYNMKSKIKEIDEENIAQILKSKPDEIVRQLLDGYTDLPLQTDAKEADARRAIYAEALQTHLNNVSPSDIASINALVNYKTTNETTAKLIHDAASALATKLNEQLDSGSAKDIPATVFCLFHLLKRNEMNERKPNKEYNEGLQALTQRIKNTYQLATLDQLEAYHEFLVDLQCNNPSFKENDFNGLIDHILYLHYEKSGAKDIRALQELAQRDYLPAIYKLAKHFDKTLANEDEELAFFYLCGKIKRLADKSMDPVNRFNVLETDLQEMRACADKSLTKYFNEPWSSKRRLYNVGLYNIYVPSFPSSAHTDTIILNISKGHEEQEFSGIKYQEMIDWRIRGIKLALGVSDAWIRDKKDPPKKESVAESKTSQPQAEAQPVPAELKLEKLPIQETQKPAPDSQLPGAVSTEATQLPRSEVTTVATPPTGESQAYPTISGDNKASAPELPADPADPAEPKPVEVQPRQPSPSSSPVTVLTGGVTTPDVKQGPPFGIPVTGLTPKLSAEKKQKPADLDPTIADLQQFINDNTVDALRDGKTTLACAIIRYHSFRSNSKEAGQLFNFILLLISNNATLDHASVKDALRTVKPDDKLTLLCNQVKKHPIREIAIAEFYAQLDDEQNAEKWYLKVFKTHQDNYIAWLKRKNKLLRLISVYEGSGKDGEIDYLRVSQKANPRINFLAKMALARIYYLKQFNLRRELNERLDAVKPSTAYPLDEETLLRLIKENQQSAKDLQLTHLEQIFVFYQLSQSYQEAGKLLEVALATPPNECEDAIQLIKIFIKPDREKKENAIRPTVPDDICILQSLFVLAQAKRDQEKEPAFNTPFNLILMHIAWSNSPKNTQILAAYLASKLFVEADSQLYPEYFSLTSNCAELLNALKAFYGIDCEYDPATVVSTLEKVQFDELNDPNLIAHAKFIIASAYCQRAIKEEANSEQQNQFISKAFELFESLVANSSYHAKILDQLTFIDKAIKDKGLENQLRRIKESIEFEKQLAQIKKLPIAQRISTILQKHTTLADDKKHESHRLMDVLFTTINRHLFAEDKTDLVPAAIDTLLLDYKKETTQNIAKRALDNIEKLLIAKLELAKSTKQEHYLNQLYNLYQRQYNSTLYKDKNAIYQKIFSFIEKYPDSKKSDELLRELVKQDYLPAIAFLARKMSGYLMQTIDVRSDTCYLCAKILLLTQNKLWAQKQFNLTAQTLQIMVAFANDYLRSLSSCTDDSNSAKSLKALSQCYQRCISGCPTDKIVISADAFILQSLQPSELLNTVMYVHKSMNNVLHVDKAWRDLKAKETSTSEMTASQPEQKTTVVTASTNGQQSPVIARSASDEAISQAPAEEPQQATYTQALQSEFSGGTDLLTTDQQQAAYACYSPTMQQQMASNNPILYLIQLAQQQSQQLAHQSQQLQQHENLLRQLCANGSGTNTSNATTTATALCHPERSEGSLQTTPPLQAGPVYGSYGPPETKGLQQNSLFSPSAPPADPEVIESHQKELQFLRDTIATQNPNPSARDLRLLITAAEASEQPNRYLIYYYHALIALSHPTIMNEINSGAELKTSANYADNWTRNCVKTSLDYLNSTHHSSVRIWFEEYVPVNDTAEDKRDLFRELTLIALDRELNPQRLSLC